MNKKIILFLSFLVLLITNINSAIDLLKLNENDAKLILILDPYAILGLDTNANKEDVKEAFKSLILKYHPDKNKNISDDKKWVPHVIIEAKNKILNPQKKSLFLNSNEDEYLFLKLKVIQLYSFNKVFQFINIINEILKIEKIGCCNEDKIRFNAKINKILHILSFLIIEWRLIIAYILTNKNNYLKNNPVKPINPLVYLSRWANILPSISALYFSILDCKIQKNAKKIAEETKKQNISFKNEKLKQYIWLAFNKIVPYLGLYYFGRKHSGLKNETLDDLFKKMLDINDVSYDSYYAQIFEIFNSISNVSEIFRNYSRYNLILKSLRK